MNILVHGTNWIGDAVMTIPALRTMRALFPDARLALLTREWARDMFMGTDLFDEVVTTAPLLQQAAELRRKRFDLAVAFPNSFRSALALRLGGAKMIFGYATERRSPFLTHPIPVPEWKNDRHEVYYYLELVKAVEKTLLRTDIEPTDLEPRLQIGEQRLNEAKELLRQSGIVDSRHTVALAPGSTNSQAKRWTPASFARLNDRLQSELGVNVVLLGSKDDQAVTQEVARISVHRPIDLAGRTSLGQAAAVLGSMKLLISNDMGLAHLAPAVGTTTIVIFGPTNPITTRPFSENAFVVSANVECAPCMLRTCPIDHRCMTRISADDVYEKAKVILNGI